MTTEEIKEAEDYASQNSRYYDDHEQDWSALKDAYLAGRQVGIEENELLRKELLAYKILCYNSIFNIVMNANDYFYYACAMGVEVCDTDIEWMIPIISKYGFDGAGACMAYIQNQEPIKPRITENFTKAIYELIELRPTVHSDFDNSEYYNMETEVYRKPVKS